MRGVILYAWHYSGKPRVPDRKEVAMNIWWIFSILWIIVVAFFAIVDAKRIWRTRKKNILTKQDILLRVNLFLMVFVFIGTGVPMAIKAVQGELSLPFVHAPSWVLAITLATAILESIIAAQSNVFVVRGVKVVVRFGKDGEEEVT